MKLVLVNRSNSSGIQGANEGIFTQKISNLHVARNAIRVLVSLMGCRGGVPATGKLFVEVFFSIN